MCLASITRYKNLCEIILGEGAHESTVPAKAHLLHGCPRSTGAQCHEEIAQQTRTPPPQHPQCHIRYHVCLCRRPEGLRFSNRPVHMPPPSQPHDGFTDRAVNQQPKKRALCYRLATFSTSHREHRTPKLPPPSPHPLLLAASSTAYVPSSATASLTLFRKGNWAIIHPSIFAPSPAPPWIITTTTETGSIPQIDPCSRISLSRSPPSRIPRTFRDM